MIPFALAGCTYATLAMRGRRNTPNYRHHAKFVASLREKLVDAECDSTTIRRRAECAETKVSAAKRRSRAHRLYGSIAMVASTHGMCTSSQTSTYLAGCLHIQLTVGISRPEFNMA
jgi:hypothetical protein